MMQLTRLCMRWKTTTRAAATTTTTAATTTTTAATTATTTTTTTATFSDTDLFVSRQNLFWSTCFRRRKNLPESRGLTILKFKVLLYTIPTGPLQKPLA